MIRWTTHLAAYAAITVASAALVTVQPQAVPEAHAATLFDDGAGCAEPPGAEKHGRAAPGALARSL